MLCDVVCYCVFMCYDVNIIALRCVVCRAYRRGVCGVLFCYACLLCVDVCVCAFVVWCCVLVCDVVLHCVLLCIVC